MTDDEPSLIDRLVEFDKQRDSLPGEHWLTFALGVYLLLRSRRSATARIVSVAAGGLLVARALSGRDGAIAALQRGGEDEGDDDLQLTEIAAPWPYDRRVRLSTPRRIRRGARATAPA
jgi:hypothetical protein